MKKLFFILLAVLIFTGCDNSGGASKVSEEPKPVINPIWGTWERSDGAVYIFRDDDSFEYWNSAGVLWNSGYYATSTGVVTVNDPVKSMTISYYYEFLTDYYLPGDEVMKFSLYTLPTSITYWVRVGE